MIIYSMWMMLKAVLLYLLFAIILGLVPYNRDFVQNRNGHEIFVISNGIHTDLVLPVNTPAYSWNEFFNNTLFRGKTGNAKYIAFGWGNKEFYLNTPEWKDLSASIAFNALFIKTEPAMHVTLLSDVHLGKNVRSVLISGKELQLLTEYILSSFAPDDSGKPVPISNVGYGPDDLFFEARGKFSIFKPCNEWTNEGLKTAGIRCVVWSPFDKPLLRSLSDAVNN